jgi:hypothetical protein
MFGIDTNQNCMHEQIKSRLNSANIFYLCFTFIMQEYKEQKIQGVAQQKASQKALSQK